MFAEPACLLLVAPPTADCSAHPLASWHNLGQGRYLSATWFLPRLPLANLVSSRRSGGAFAGREEAPALLAGGNALQLGRPAAGNLLVVLLAEFFDEGSLALVRCRQLPLQTGLKLQRQEKQLTAGSAWHPCTWLLCTCLQTLVKTLA